MDYTKPPTWIVNSERIVAPTAAQAALTLAARLEVEGLYRVGGAKYLVSKDQIGWKCITPYIFSGPQPKSGTSGTFGTFLGRTNHS